MKRRRKSIARLLDELAAFGSDRIVFPIDMWKLANAFAEHPEQRAAIAGLIGFLTHESHFHRHIAVRALRLIGGDALNSEVIERAVAMLASDESAPLRAEAARLLGSAPSTPRIRAVLIKAASADDTDFVRDDAQRSLRALEDIKAERCQK